MGLYISLTRESEKNVYVLVNNWKRGDTIVFRCDNGGQAHM